MSSTGDLYFYNNHESLYLCSLLSSGFKGSKNSFNYPSGSASAGDQKEVSVVLNFVFVPMTRHLYMHYSV